MIVMAERAGEKRHLSVRLDRLLLAKLQVHADSQDRSLAYMIERAVAEFLDRHEGEADAARGPAKRPHR